MILYNYSIIYFNVAFSHRTAAYKRLKNSSGCLAVLCDDLFSSLGFLKEFSSVTAPSPGRPEDRDGYQG